MEGILINYRMGQRTQTPNQMIIEVSGYDKKKAEGLIGKKVSYICEGKKKEIKGEIVALHGTKGAVRAIFETGMPGQAIGGKVSIN